MDKNSLTVKRDPALVTNLWKLFEDIKALLEPGLAVMFLESALLLDFYFVDRVMREMHNPETDAIFYEKIIPTFADLEKYIPGVAASVTSEQGVLKPVNALVRARGLKYEISGSISLEFIRSHILKLHDEFTQLFSALKSRHGTTEAGMTL